MFDNVPQRLADAVKAIPEGERVFPARYAQPAGLVIVEYLRRLPTGSEADEFFNFDPKSDGSIGYEHVVRMLMVGETLFLLRNQPGFPEFCRRLREENFDPLCSNY